MTKYILLLCLALSTFSTFAKNYYADCDGCSSYKMKQLAESVYLPYGTAIVDIFDKSDKEYRRYKLSKVFIDDFIAVTKATEISYDYNVKKAFGEYVDASNNAKDAASLIGSIRVDFWGQSTHAIVESYSSNGTCEATPVTKDQITAHNVIRSSQNRRLIFHALKEIADYDVGTKLQLAGAKYGKFAGLLETSKSQLVAGAAGAISKVDLNTIKIPMADGGFVVGSLDFNSETFVVDTAVDGDCNTIPLEPPKFGTTFNVSTVSGDNRLIEHLTDMLGGQLYIPSCRKQVKVCTGVNGQITNCTNICFRYE